MGANTNTALPEGKCARHWLDAWETTPHSNKEYEFIDGLRGIAILLVLMCHFVYINPQSGSLTHFIGGIAGSGYLGVPVFFSLSGFLISWPFWKLKIRGAPRTVPPGYAWRRFYKIYPPIALSVLLFTPLYIFRSGDWSYLTPAWQWLIGLPIFRPVSGKLNPVMWSLIVELQFYITLPLLFLCLKRFSAKATLCIVTLVFILVPESAAWINFIHGRQLVLSPEINVYFPSLLSAFALGVMLAGLQSMGKLTAGWAKLGDFGFILLALSILANAWLTFRAAGRSHLEILAVQWCVRIASACLICYVANPRHPRARMLSAGWLRWCGIVSYEWYLFHQPLALWARQDFGSSGGDLLKYLRTLSIPFVTALILSALIYRYFSRPLLQSGRARHSGAKTPVKVQAASTV